MAEGKFVLAAPLNRHWAGKTFDRLPPHVTIIPPFILPLRELLFADSLLSETIDLAGSIEIVGGEIANYGDNGEVKVRKVRGISPELHLACREILTDLGVHVDPKYTGSNWSPHVSDFHNFNEGETRSIEQVAMFGYLGSGQKQIRAIYGSECYVATMNDSDFAIKAL